MGVWPSEDMMKDGGVAMVMRMEHAGSGQVPLETRQEDCGDERGGQYYLLLLDMAY